MSGGTEPYTVSWNDVTGQVGQTASGLCTGSYIATVTDANGCVYEVNVGISGSTTSLVENMQPSFALFPNPTKQFITISGMALTKETNIKCISAIGQRMELKTHSFSEQGCKVDVSHFARGVYFIEIHSNGQAVTRRFIRE
jgi:hypothetical protein